MSTLENCMFEDEIRFRLSNSMFVNERNLQFAERGWFATGLREQRQKDAAQNNPHFHTLQCQCYH